MWSYVYLDLDLLLSQFVETTALIEVGDLVANALDALQAGPEVDIMLFGMVDGEGNNRL